MNSPARAGTAALRLRGLVKRYGPVTAVAGVDLTVDRGQVVAFLGPNGAGKTSTIDMVLGLSRPAAGDVEVLGGTPVAAVAGGRVAAVLQSGGLLGGTLDPPGAADAAAPGGLRPGQGRRCAAARRRPCRARPRRAGGRTGAELSATAWLEVGVAAWACSLEFAAFGL